MKATINSSLLAKPTPSDRPYDVRDDKLTGFPSHLNHCFVKTFGDKSLNELHPALIDQWRTQRLKENISVETVNRNVATLKAALSKAALWDLIETHPLEKLKLLKSDRSGKIRFPSPAEEQRLRDAAIARENEMRTERKNANDWRKQRGYDLYPDLHQVTFVDYIQPMILLSINTGMRRGELFSLCWKNVNFEQAVLTIEGSYAKSGKTRHIPLNTEAVSILKCWQNQSEVTDYVFPSKNGKQFDNVKKSWASILRIASISNL
jgi:integrase